MKVSLYLSVQYGIVQSVALDVHVMCSSITPAMSFMCVLSHLIKSAFSKLCNKEHIMLPYTSSIGMKRKRGASLINLPMFRGF